MHSDNSNLIAFEEGDTRNLKLIDDDMLIDFDEMSESNQEAVDVDGQVIASKAGRDLTDIQATYWKNGLLPLKFESTFTQAEKDTVFNACAKWSKVANVNCVYYNSSLHGTNYLNVTKSGAGCYAAFGKPSSGPGYINLSTQEAVTYSLPQGTCMIPGIAMHEFGHVLGMIHEHSRPDRDTYVTLNTQNLKSTCVSSFSFKYTNDQIVRKGANYDFKSITHYANKHCSANGQTTFDPKPAYNLGTYQLGDAVLKNAALSTFDADFAQEIYGDRLIQAKTFPGSNQCGTVNCSLEDPRDKAGPPSNARYLINNDPASINRRCVELGYSFGDARQFYTHAEWCHYSNARTKYWNGTKWVLTSCREGNVKQAVCF